MTPCKRPGCPQPSVEPHRFCSAICAIHVRTYREALKALESLEREGVDLAPMLSEIDALISVGDQLNEYQAVRTAVIS